MPDSNKGITHEELVGVRDRYELLERCLERGNQETGEAVAGQILGEDVPNMLAALERIDKLVINRPSAVDAQAIVDCLEGP